MCSWEISEITSGTVFLLEHGPCALVIISTYTFTSFDSEIDNNWGFGQVVAITVWIPPLVEYIVLGTREALSFCVISISLDFYAV